jgi:hypothetical protein
MVLSTLLASNARRLLAVWRGRLRPIEQRRGSLLVGQLEESCRIAEHRRFDLSRRCLANGLSWLALRLQCDFFIAFAAHKSQERAGSPGSLSRSAPSPGEM